MSSSVRLAFLSNSSGNELESSLENFENSSLSPLLNCNLQFLTYTFDIEEINTRALTGLLACLEVKDIGRKSNASSHPP